MRRVWTPWWIVVHLSVLVLVVGFLALGWWQVNRAAEGNLLSYGYAVEWPAFAGFLIFVWIREMRKAVRSGTEPAAEADAVPVKTATVRSATRGARKAAAYDDSDDPALAAYNHYLAWLNEHPNATPAQYPGLPAQ